MEEPMFAGRENELAALEERYASGRFEMGVIYGRRRVGKTTLLSEFIKGKPAIFFSAIKISAQQNLIALSDCITAYTGGEPSGAVFPSFSAAFKSVFELAKEERLVFVIDEYPFLAQASEGVSSVLQHLIDHGKSDSKMMLVVNGSSVGQMREQFMLGSSPLYGRKTFQIKVQPLGFFEMCSYFDKGDDKTLPYIYGVYGGTPKYFEGYKQNQSLKRNIMRDYLQAGAMLLEEPEDILRREIREPATYNAVFTAIAQGASKYSEISSKANLESGNVNSHIKTLEMLDLVRKDAPAGKNGKAKTQYVISDNMFRFWYRFIPYCASLINAGRAEQAYTYIAENLEQYMGQVFEQICLEWLWRVDGSDALPFTFEEAGRWWGANPATKAQAEVDIVAYNGKGEALFGECKWSTNKVGTDILETLEEKATIPSFAVYKKRSYCLFARSGFTKACEEEAAARDDVFLVSLADMLAS
jgi:AAA+ ATPase superfamily predicted ATPase